MGEASTVPPDNTHKGLKMYLSLNEIIIPFRSAALGNQQLIFVIRNISSAFFFLSNFSFIHQLFLFYCHGLLLKNSLHVIGNDDGFVEIESLNWC